MSIGAILIGLALLILSVPVVAGPIINKRREGLSLADEPAKPEVQEDYSQTLMALRDLDFDHQLGIVAEDDYATLRTQLLASAAQAREVAGTEQISDLEERIETAVRSRRRPRFLEQEPAVACYQCGAEMESSDRFCVSCGSAAAPICSQCDRQANPGDRFCAGCGAYLKVKVAA